MRIYVVIMTIDGDQNVFIKKSKRESVDNIARFFDDLNEKWWYLGEETSLRDCFRDYLEDSSHGFIIFSDDRSHTCGHVTISLFDTSDMRCIESGDWGI